MIAPGCGDRSVRGVTYYQQTLLMPMPRSQNHAVSQSRPHGQPARRRPSKGNRDSLEINAILAYFD